MRSVGVVYDPLLDELFEPCAARGAWLQRPADLRVSKETRFGRALIATGFAYDVRHDAEPTTSTHFARFDEAARAACAATAAPRSISAMSRAAASTAYWELKLHAWDVAAGILIVEEAGGRVSDLAGGPPPRVGPRDRRRATASSTTRC